VAGSQVLIHVKGNLQIKDYKAQDRPVIRLILEKIGWSENFVMGAEIAADIFSRDTVNSRAFVAFLDGKGVGFLSVQFYEWNRLAQIHSLAVDPSIQRNGVASTLVFQAEEFAKSRHARGIYVDTPVSNTGGCNFYDAIGFQASYVMPRYYADQMDGITYQKFFSE
jgi:ribosomal protein S18 acetylase RimI-like enzyme